MNNYLKGNDMRPCVTIWEYEERIIPLRKIVDIFHESGNQKLKCYILTSPLDEERFSVLKAHDDLEAYSGVVNNDPYHPVNDHPRKHRKTRPVVYL